MKTLLLHSCCGPCSTHVINVLKADYDVTVFYFNPNIHPRKEYYKRLKEAKKVADLLNVRFVEGEYEPKLWFEKIKGFEKEPENGKRCPLCFDMRLEETARFAEERGFDFFTSTLTVSPYKKADEVNASGKKAEKNKKTEFLEANFKKKNGYLNSQRMSRDMGLYRQHYCGCAYSRISSMASPNEKNR